MTVQMTLGLIIGIGVIVACLFWGNGNPFRRTRP
jgi:hypothetical protein